MTVLYLTALTCFVIGLTSANHGSPPSVAGQVLRVQPGQTLYASCQSGKKDVVDIYWTKPDGHPVTLNPESNVYSSLENRQSTLVVQEASEVDEGEYICHELSGEGEIAVNERFILRTSFEASPPLFEEEYEIIEPNAGSNVTLSCMAHGDRPMEYTWIDNHSLVITESTPGVVVYKRANSSELNLIRVSNETSGVYTCTASNHLGKVSKLFRVIVNETAVVEEYIPVFEEKRVEVYGTLNSPLHLLCRAEGKPKPTYYWYNKQYGERLDRFHPRVIDLDRLDLSVVPRLRNNSILVSNINGSLTFAQLQKDDDGHCTCYAQNSQGTAYKTYRIYVNESEVPESNDSIVFSVHNVTDTSVTFNISAPGNPGIPRFEARYWLIDTSNNFSTIRWVAGKEYTVSSLLSGAKYYFQLRMRLENSLFSNWTDTFLVSLPPGPPEIILRQVTPQKIQMEFFRPIYMFTYDTITHYIIKYRTVQQLRGNEWSYSNCEVSITLPFCRGNYYEISGLQSKIYYSITVQAVGSGGGSTISEFKTYMP